MKLLEIGAAICAYSHISCALCTLKLSQAQPWLLAEVCFGSPPREPSLAIPEFLLSQASSMHTDGPVGSNKSRLRKKSIGRNSNIGGNRSSCTQAVLELITTDRA